jgi:hypothetical protein
MTERSAGGNVQVLSGEALGLWLVDQLMSPGGKVTVKESVLDEARTMLTKTKSVSQLRASAEALAGLAEHLGGKRKDVKAGEAILKLVLELKPRFEGAIADRGFAKVEASRDTKNKLGGKAAAADVMASDQPAVAATRFRGPMKG